MVASPTNKASQGAMAPTGRRSLLAMMTMSDSSSQSWNDFHQKYHSDVFHYSAKNEDFMLRHPDAYVQRRKSATEDKHRQPAETRQPAVQTKRKRQMNLFSWLGLCQSTNT